MISTTYLTIYHHAGLTNAVYVAIESGLLFNSKPQLRPAWHWPIEPLGYIVSLMFDVWWFVGNPQQFYIYCYNNLFSVYWSPPSVAYMRQWIESVLVQIMACCLFGAKTLSKPMMAYYQSDPKEQTPVIYCCQTELFHSRKCIWKCLQDGGHFVQGDMS